MDGQQVRRVGAVAGAGTFLVALIGCLVVLEPGTALLVSLGAGVALGLGIFLAGSIAMLNAPLPLSAAVARAESPAGAVSARSAAPDVMTSPPNEDTARLSPDEVIRSADLHQTVRLDQDHLEYVLPEMTPEDIFREREGIDEQFLRAGIGIEEPRPASDNEPIAPGEMVEGNT